MHWQRNIQTIQSWGDFEQRNDYLQQQIQYYEAWKSQGAPIPSITSQSLSIHHESASVTPTLPAPPSVQPEIGNIAVLELKETGIGVTDPWTCGYCHMQNNTSLRCSQCNRVYFTYVSLGGLSDTILQLFTPPVPAKSYTVCDLSKLGMRDASAKCDTEWKCYACEQTENTGCVCSQCSRFNFQAVTDYSLPEEIQTLFRTSEPEPSELPEEIHHIEAIPEVGNMEMRRVRDRLNPPWCCYCGQENYELGKCETCKRVNFASQSVPKNILNAIQKALNPPIEVVEPLPEEKPLVEYEREGLEYIPPLHDGEEQDRPGLNRDGEALEEYKEGQDLSYPLEKIDTQIVNPPSNSKEKSGKQNGRRKKSPSSGGRWTCGNCCLV